MDQRISLVEIYARGVPLVEDMDTHEVESISDDELAVAPGDALDAEGIDAEYLTAYLQQRPPYPTLAGVSEQLTTYMREQQMSSVQESERPPMPLIRPGQKRESPKIKSGRLFHLFAFRLWPAKVGDRQPQPISTPWLAPTDAVRSLQSVLFDQEEIDYAGEVTRDRQRRARRARR